MRDCVSLSNATVRRNMLFAIAVFLGSCQSMTLGPLTIVIPAVPVAVVVMAVSIRLPGLVRSSSSILLKQSRPNFRITLGGRVVFMPPTMYLRGAMINVDEVASNGRASPRNCTPIYTHKAGQSNYCVTNNNSILSCPS